MAAELFPAKKLVSSASSSSSSSAASLQQQNLSNNNPAPGGCSWQGLYPTIRERNSVMFNNEMMADVHFVVGPPGGTQRVPGHKPFPVGGDSLCLKQNLLETRFCWLVLVVQFGPSDPVPVLLFLSAVRPGRGQLRVSCHVLRRAGRGHGGDPDPGRGAAVLPGHAEVHLLRRDRPVRRHGARHPLRRQEVHRAPPGAGLRQLPGDEPERQERVRASVAELPVRGAGPDAALLGGHRRAGRASAALRGLLRHRRADAGEHPAAGDAQRQGDGRVRGGAELGRGRVPAPRPAALHRQQAAGAGQGHLPDPHPRHGAGGLRQRRGAVRRADAQRDQRHLPVVHGVSQAGAAVLHQAAEGAGAAALPPLPVLRLPQQPVALPRPLRQHPVRRGPPRLHRRLRPVRLQLRLGRVQRQDGAEAAGRAHGAARHQVLLRRLQQHLPGLVRLPGPDRARHLLHGQRGSGRQRAQLLWPGGHDGGPERKGHLPVPVLLRQHQRDRGPGRPDPRTHLLRLIRAESGRGRKPGDYFQWRMNTLTV